MKFGITLPHYGRPWDQIFEDALRAEELGFASVWVSDHLVFDFAKYGGSSDRLPSLDWVAMVGALARTTSRVRLGLLVGCAPLRTPVMWAKAALTLHRLSGERFELGLGAGWYPPDFEIADIEMKPATERVSELGEVASEVRDLLNGRGAPLSPVSDNPPYVFIGGKGGRGILRAVAGSADGWNVAWEMTPERYRGRLDVLADECRRSGRDPKEIRLSVGLSTLVGEDETELRDRWELLGALGDLQDWRKSRLAGTPDQVRSRVREFEALGVEEIICSFGSAPFQVAPEDNVRLFAATMLG